MDRVEKTSFHHSAELKTVQKSIEGSLKSDPTPSCRKSRRFGVARGHADGGPRSWGRRNGIDGAYKKVENLDSCFWGFGFFVKSFIKNCPPPPDLLPVLLLNTCDSRKRRKVWSEVGSEECGERRRVECGVRLILMTASWGSQNFC